MPEGPEGGWSPQEGDALYRALLVSLPDAVLIHADQRIVHVNPAAVRLFRAHTAQDLVGLDPFELIHPDSREAVRERVRRSAGNGPTPPAEDKALAVDGTAIDVEVVGVDCVFQGRAARQVLVRDIRERKRLDRERESALDDLRRSRNLLERAQVIGGFGIWTSEWEDEPTGRGRLWWSPEVFRTMGVAPETFDGRNATFFSLLSEEDRTAIGRAARRAAEQHSTFEIEHRVLRPDGRERWVHEWAQFERDDEGRPLLLVGICQDVTERRRIERESEETRRMETVGRLAGGIAHDFNNLLGVILSGLEMASREVRRGTMADAMLKDCESAATEASGLVRELLAYARRQPTSPRTIDLSDALTRLDPVLRRLSGEMIELRIEGDRGLWPVTIDPVQLEQVLLNLTANARDEMPEGGLLSIRASNVPGGVWGPAGAAGPGAPEDRVELTVSDTGAGFDDGSRMHVFEPFASIRSDGMSTGLGLATCRSIVTQAGGTITAENAAGRGTVFRIRLPRSVDAVAHTPAPREPAPAVGGRERILLVEDGEQLRRLTVMILEAAGYTVVAATCAREALTLAADEQQFPDVIVTDVVMPGMDGRRLVEALRRQRPAVPAVFVSGYNDDRQLASVPRSTFLGKPYAPDELLRAIRAVIENASEAVGG